MKTRAKSVALSAALQRVAARSGARQDVGATVSASSRAALGHAACGFHSTRAQNKSCWKTVFNRLGLGSLHSHELGPIRYIYIYRPRPGHIWLA